MGGWENRGGSEGEARACSDDLGPAWTEALLSADLTSQERKSWAKQMDAWQEELNDSGVDEAFIAAHEAAIQGWEYPPLKRVLHGTINEHGARNGERPL